MAGLRTPEAVAERVRHSRSLKSEWRDKRTHVYAYRSRNGVWMTCSEVQWAEEVERPKVLIFEGNITERHNGA